MSEQKPLHSGSRAADLSGLEQNLEDFARGVAGLLLAKHGDPAAKARASADRIRQAMATVDEVSAWLRQKLLEFEASPDQVDFILNQVFVRATKIVSDRLSSGEHGLADLPAAGSA